MDEEEEEEEPEGEAEGRAAPEATGMEGRLRMSLMPWGVAAESCCGGLPRDESPPAVGGFRLPGLWAPKGGEGDDEEDEEEEEEGGPAGNGGYAAGYRGVFISAMLCRAARGGLLSRNALCRVPSIAPTANIPRPGRSPQPLSEGARGCPGGAQESEECGGRERRVAPRSPRRPANWAGNAAAESCSRSCAAEMSKHATGEAVARRDQRASGRVWLSFRS